MTSPSLMKADTSPSIADSSINSSTADVGQAPYLLSAQVDTADFTDDEREAAAYRAGVAMHAWYSKYQSTGDRQALSIAHRHMTLMVQILAGRSPEYVAKLEAERGLT